MTWAKEARNFVEKEGDLEINSKLMVTLTRNPAAVRQLTH
jgi:hypothetical protein